MGDNISDGDVLNGTGPWFACGGRFPVPFTDSAHAHIEWLSISGPEPVETVAENFQIGEQNIGDISPLRGDEDKSAVHIGQQSITDHNISNSKAIAFAELDPRGGG